MLRQRSKKLSDSRKTDAKSREVHALDFAHERDQSESDNESLDIQAKDDEEEELDRLVLGDGAGFKTQLNYDINMGYDEDSQSDREVIEKDEDAEGGLENVDDADVSKTPPFSTMSANFCQSFSSSIQDHLLLNRTR
jgi:U3 small nucleolar RNA-associated protein 18